MFEIKGRVSSHQLIIPANSSVSSKVLNDVGMVAVVELELSLELPWDFFLLQ
jgi:hypothetical protein